MEQVTNDKGVACFDELAWGGEGTEYTVKETVPEGYVVDGGNNKVVTVGNNASCWDSPYEGETLNVNNTPLTDITVSVDSRWAVAPNRKSPVRTRGMKRLHLEKPTPTVTARSTPRTCFPANIPAR